jgi:hypothetical protein
LLTGFNDLATKAPDIASQANGWNPAETFFRSNIKLSWKCGLGHIWNVSASNRIYSNSGCPYCAGKKIFPGFNDLATLSPDLAAEANGWDPTTTSLNSHKKLSWKCQCGFVWKASPNNRVTLNRNGKSQSQVYGCPSCAGKIAIPGTNDLASLLPEIAREAYGWDPTVELSVSHKRLAWKCNLGHTWNATISNRSSRASKCPVCAGVKLLSGFNDLQTLYPDIASQILGTDPSEVLAGTHKKYKWQCPSLHTWVATVSSRTSGGNGCASCSNSGFDQNEKGFLYFIRHSHWQMLQIGITNTPKRRIHEHSLLGWELIELRGPMDGHLANDWESAILRMLKAKGADLSNSKIAGKFNGYSEAWSKATFDVNSIKELMRLTEEFENK